MVSAPQACIEPYKHLTTKIDMQLLNQTLDQQIPSFIQTNISLADKNWFKTGGSAHYFAQPKTAQEFADALAFAREQTIPIFVLGQGANILISDAGFAGLVIQPSIQDIVISQEIGSQVIVTMGAGLSVSDAIEWCLEQNISGLEEFSGIPGTIGGSVFINLHYYEFLLEHFLVHATVINTKTMQISLVTKDWFKFGYNESTLQTHEYLLVDATFNLKKISELETAFARGRRTEIIRHREKRYPSKNTCGSFFRNFLPHEVTLESAGKKVIWVAYYLDKVGIKGTLRVGDAIVSHQHANMIVNLGNATSTDIINLAKTMQEMVYQEFGITPQAECRLIGFNEYPLTNQK